MVRPPILKPKEVESILLKHAFILKRQSGSHRIYLNPHIGTLVVVPFHLYLFFILFTPLFFVHLNIKYFLHIL